MTFQEVRLHLGVETQRQWADLAIARTAPVLVGLFSLVTLAAHNLYQEEGFSPRGAAWYRKALPTFSDALATLRGRLWRASGVFARSSRGRELEEIPVPLLDRLIETLCYAA